MEGTAARAALSLEQLAAELHKLELRVERLEREELSAPAASISEPSAAQTGPKPGEARLTPASPVSIPILGRAVLGVAGAYLLRALVESGTIPQTVGVAAAFLYGVTWLVAASRVLGELKLAVPVYAITSALVVGPMLWEATRRFHALSPAVTAALLAAYMVCGAILGWQRRLPALSWITTLAGVGTVFALFFATQAVVPLCGALLVIAAVVEFAACRDYFFAERWVPALAADLFVLALTQLTLRPPVDSPAIPVEQALLLQTALLAIYLGSTVYRTLVHRMPMMNFEIVQCILAFVIALGSALRIAQDRAAVALGVLCLLAGAACYLVAFAVFEHQDRRRNFRVYAVFAVALLCAAGGILFSGQSARATVFWSALALMTAAGARRIRSFTMVIHCALYLLAAASVSGLLSDSTAAMLGQSLPQFPPAWTLTVATLVAAVCFAVAPALPAIPARLSAAVVAGIVCWGVLGAIAAGIGSALGNVALLPALRTTFLCLMAGLLVFAVARLRRTELLWLMYPLTAFTLYKLVTEDFVQGRPATLAVTLLVCGTTLILLPRRIRAVTQLR